MAIVASKMQIAPCIFLDLWHQRFSRGIVINSVRILLDERLVRIGWRRLYAILDGLDVIPGSI
jgi:hypothetical protein